MVEGLGGGGEGDLLVYLSVVWFVVVELEGVVVVGCVFGEVGVVDVVCRVYYFVVVLLVVVEVVGFMVVLLVYCVVVR